MLPATRQTNRSPSPVSKNLGRDARVGAVDYGCERALVRRDVHAPPGRLVRVLEAPVCEPQISGDEPRHRGDRADDWAARRIGGRLERWHGRRRGRVLRAGAANSTAEAPVRKSEREWCMGSAFPEEGRANPRRVVRGCARNRTAMTTLAVSPELFADTVAIRRDLHAHPELAFEETRTAGIVAERLRALGLEVHTGIGGTGVVGVLAGAQTGPTIMLRADMDALPMPEENDVAYVSRNAGVTHACGHDAHVAMLLGAAAVLRERTSEIHGRIAFVFQPAEEGGGGARAMLDDGLIARFGIERAYGLHIVNVAGTDIAPSGSFGCVRVR